MGIYVLAVRDNELNNKVTIAKGGTGLERTGLRNDVVTELLKGRKSQGICWIQLAPEMSDERQALVTIWACFVTWLCMTIRWVTFAFFSPWPNLNSQVHLVTILYTSSLPSQFFQHVIKHARALKCNQPNRAKRCTWLSSFREGCPTWWESWLRSWLQRLPHLTCIFTAELSQEKENVKCEAAKHAELHRNKKAIMEQKAAQHEQAKINGQDGKSFYSVSFLHHMWCSQLALSIRSKLCLSSRLRYHHWPWSLSVFLLFLLEEELYSFLTLNHLQFSSSPTVTPQSSQLNLCKRCLSSLLHHAILTLPQWQLLLRYVFFFSLSKPIHTLQESNPSTV